MMMRNRNNILISMLLVLIIGVLLTGCNLFGGDGDPGGDDGSGDNTNDTKSRDQVLMDLGFNLELSDPVDDFGEPVGERNPFGTTTTTLMRINELYMVGATTTSWGTEMILEEPVGTMESLYTKEYAAGDEWMHYPKKSVSADIDGDGYDEIITAVFIAENNKLQFQIKDYNNTSPDPTNFDNENCLDVLKSPKWSFDNFFKRDFTTGDFDGDGNPDFAVSCGGTVIILNYNLTTQRLTEQTRFELDHLNTGDGVLLDDGDWRMVRVEAGDLNGDNIAELVVVNGTRKKYQGEYYIFEGTIVGTLLSDNLTSKAVLSGNLRGKTQNYSAAEVAIGDINGNGLNDIVFAGFENTSSDNYYNCYFSAIDPFNESGSGGFFNMQYLAEDYRFAADLPYYNSGMYEPENYYVSRTVLGDFDGDGKDEIHILDKTYSLESGQINWFNEGIFNTYNTSGDTGHRNDMFYDLAVAGDLNGNGSEELIFLTTYDLPWNGSKMNEIDINYLKIWGKNSSGSIVEHQNIAINGNSKSPSLALANVDDDSLVLKFNKRTLHFSEPQILAILASPPYSPTMDISGSSTTLGITSGEETTEGYANGFNVGVGVGISAEIELGLGLGGGRKLVVENEFAWGFGSSTSQSLAYGFTAAAGTDMVQFTAIPIDVYIYEILSAPDPDSIGESYTINIPRKSETRFMDVTSYNKLVNKDQQIPNNILNHTIGNPQSYYTASDMEGFKSAEKGFFSRDTQSIAVGAGGTTSIGIESEDVTSDCYEYNLMTGVENSCKILVVDIDYSLGYTYNYSIEHQISKGISFEGVVGGFDTHDDSVGNDFRWGIMMIPQTFGDQNFNLVTYWVE